MAIPDSAFQRQRLNQRSKNSMPANTICFINQKGGCGKSSSCFHLAGQFAASGLRVLVIDADPQGSLSQGFFGSATIENLLARETLAAVFADDELHSADVLAAATPHERISVIRANAQLARHNTPQPEKAGMKQFALASFLETVSGIDLILIDCPPNLYLCSWSAMLASNLVVIPVPPEDFATQGLRAVHEAIEQAQLLSPTLQFLGHLIIRADSRLLVHRTYEQHLRHLYGNSVLSTVIPEASAFKVALSCRQPVSLYAPNSKSARLIASLADELLQRMSEIDTGRRIA
jgi:chromosome partitioning protein